MPVTKAPTPVALGDLALALGLLTRLPVPVDPALAAARGARAAWAWPLAGLVVALLAGGLGSAALALGLPAAVAAGLALASQIVLTGALHEDGLSDAADGLWGGANRERRLEIMKDSRIGSYGALALVVSVGLRWAALASLAPALVPAMAVAGLLSRAAMATVMAALPPARTGGLSRGVGQPPAAAQALAWALALGLTLALVGALPAAAFALSAGLAALGAAAIARARIGGQTGDILGATQQLAEIACLIAASAILA